MEVWGYARSVGKLRSVGIEGQQARITAYASEHGMTLEGIAVEQNGVRGYTPIADRPVGGPLFAKLVKGDAIIVDLLERLFRSAVDALKVVADLKLRGVGLHILDLGGDMASDGRMAQFVTIANALKQGESEMGHRLGEAIRQRKADDKARGRYTGGTVPFGFKRREDGKLARDKAQQEALHLMIEMKADKKSFRTIAATVTASGFAITHAGVAGILKAREYDVGMFQLRREQAEHAAARDKAEATGFWNDGEKFDPNVGRDA